VGRAWRLLKEDPLAAESFGINVVKEKLTAFGLSAAIVGLGGALYAFQAGALFPDHYDLSRSIEILLVAVIGGLGRVWGPVVGAVILTLSFESMRVAGPYQGLIMGLIVVLVCVFAPGGLLSLRFKWPRRRGLPRAGSGLTAAGSAE